MTQSDERSMRDALRKGVARKCPRCGQAPIFDGYLSVRDTCENCGLEFHHHRADDMHPWITIMIVGHIVVPLMLFSWKSWSLPDWFHMTFWPFMVLVLCLAILPLAKGAVIAMQWAMRMHGFARES